jgi:hypothetical protein
MSHAELFTQLMQATAVAAGLLTWALATVIFAPKRWYWRAGVATVSAAATLGVLRVMLGQVTLPWMLVIGGVGLILVCISSRQFWSGIAAVIQSLNTRRPARLFALATLLLVGLGWGLAYRHYEQTQLEQADAMLAASAARNAPAVVPANTLGVTDLGQTIALEVPVDPAEQADLEELEESSVPIQQYQQNYLIRRGPPDDTSNCHGWVFTAGKYNIAGRLVSTILEQNNYISVVQPEPGDLVIYRGTNGDISHSGIVRAVLGKDDVLVESKWGRMGVYLHPADKSCYGKDFMFYRSERGSHTITLVTGEKEKPANMME